MIKIAKQVLEVDVLVVGGGIAGLMAAINAANQGVNVVIAEKANTKRSGAGATGNDHFACYLPEYHGDKMDPILVELQNSLVGGFHDPSLSVKFLEQSGDRVKDWDSWGISMKPTGKWEFTGHAFPGRPRMWLKYAGYNQKEVLTQEAKKRKAGILNHMPIVELITGGGEIVGAIGLDVSKDTPVLKIIRAKSVIICTGSTNRLYPPAGTPGMLFNTAYCPADAGGGLAAAYRAGAKLVNMEFPNRHAGPKYFARCGKATWIGIVTDLHGKPVGPFIKKATKEVGDITTDVWNSVFTDMAKSGISPAYMDCSATAKKDIDYMMWGLEHEGNTAMLNYMATEGIDVRKHRVEFMQYEINLIGRGIEIDLNGETSVPGLFAAGDLVGNFRADIAGAATFGWIAGEAAAKRAKGVKGGRKAEESTIAQDWADGYSEIMERKNGPDWKEANLALQQIMRDYLGTEVRSETMMSAGLKYLGDLRKKARSTVTADNAHNLMRALEVFDLMDCGETVFHSAMERKETRAQHRRSDFPFTNPLLANMFLTIRQEKGKLRLEWREKR
jgi:succinate dehydrogenase/fumarate reductase flavoprotein subunit